MAINKAESFLIEIGQLLAEDIEYPLDGTLLYATLDYNYVAPSIFKDQGNHVLYRRPDLDHLGDALLDLWKAQETDDRWEEIEYVIHDGRFDVTYTYPEEIDRDEEPMDRRRRIVARHFGEKPIIFPPWPPDDDGLEFDL